MKKFKINYVEYEFLLQIFVMEVEKFQFEAIYGLPRGGLPIATHVSHQLDIPLITDLSKYRKKGRLLIVDDIVDSGNTYLQFNKIAQKKELLHFNTALLFKPCSEYTPDHYVLQVPSDIWIVFPWERLNEKCIVDGTFQSILKE